MADLLRENAVYGGPYLDESTAIIAESEKEKPDFAALVKDWDTISSGALDFIDQVQKPVEQPVGPFIENFVEEEAPAEETAPVEEAPVDPVVVDEFIKTV